MESTLKQVHRLANALGLSIFLFCPLQVLNAQPDAQVSVVVPANLGMILVEQGYTTTDLGGGAHEVVAGPDASQCHIRLSFSQDETLLWMFAYFGELVSVDALSNEALLDLLTANEKFAPAYFSIATDDDEPRWLYLNQSFENSNLGAEKIQEGIENLCGRASDVIQWLAQKKSQNG